MENTGSHILSSSIETLRSDLEKLIGKFQAEKDYYLSGDYLEAQARVDFITPFFKALGWDVENEAGLAHHQREVIVERGESETTGRPDYNFRIGGQTKFFVEAKAPSEALSNPHHILQAKGYVWNTRQVFFVILTDFEEFRFYDASRQPDERNPEEGLLLDLKYGDYLSSLEKLWEFSKERVAAGSLDALLAQGPPRAAPAQAGGRCFPRRDDRLARGAGQGHSQAQSRAHRQATERGRAAIARPHCLHPHRGRPARDRKAPACRGGGGMGNPRRQVPHLRLAQRRSSTRSTTTSTAKSSSPTFRKKSKSIRKSWRALSSGFTRPKSPYRFDVIGVELLGSIYERYLGNTIRLTPKQVRVEEKPEVRKAGGVYYTPKYIVDYIVKNTVGKVIEGKIAQTD